METSLAIGFNVSRRVDLAGSPDVVAQGGGITVDRVWEIARHQGASPSSLELAQIATGAGCSVDDLLFDHDDKGRIAQLYELVEALRTSRAHDRDRLRAAQDVLTGWAGRSAIARLVEADVQTALAAVDEAART